MTLIQNNTHHYDLLLKKKGKQNFVQLRLRLGFLSYIAAEQVVDGNKMLYTELGKLDTRYLSTEVAGGFTGVMIGLYASFKGKPSNAKAFYNWFEYQL
jgi:alpha-N-arabinofuranosidase